MTPETQCLSASGPFPMQWETTLFKCTLAWGLWNNASRGALNQQEMESDGLISLSIRQYYKVHCTCQAVLAEISPVAHSNEIENTLLHCVFIFLWLAFPFSHLSFLGSSPSKLLNPAFFFPQKWLRSLLKYWPLTLPFIFSFGKVFY